MSRGKLHAIAVVATAFALVPAASRAQVFKCVSASGQASYQALPCENDGARVDLPAHAPTARERAAAQARARKEQGFVSEIESGREAAKRSARVELKRRDDERQAHAARCASYQERAERADADARMHLRRNRYKRDHESRARALRDRYFSECFAAD
ncbi:DUF4124 domain-containing protein [Aromatoleum petrolei]|uniref:DUF4124 domain-containing protein n=1 Tax=Aromatoleum petrolei TaxID=76116 RepID=UPI001AEC0EDC|nr:DUF4124 domain-containing protein [Aromatoleum petrolei]